VKRLAAILALVAAAALGAGPTDLDVARRALGDGLWSVAARHAARAADAAKDAAAREAARLVELEAFAGEERPAEILSHLDAWPDATAETFRYWRAWALAGLGRPADAGRCLAEPFRSPDLAALALRLKARLAAAAGDRAAAVDLFARASAALVSNTTARVENAVEWARALDAFGSAGEALAALDAVKAVEAPGAGGDSARLLAADLAAKEGRASEARALRTRLCAGGSNTSERAYVLAACALAEELLAAGSTNDALRVASNAVSRARRPDLVCRAGYTLGFGLLGESATRAAGRALVAETVRRFPEDPSSGSAQLRLADALLRAGDAAEAVRAYDALQQSFPSHALDAHVLEGRGWALVQLGRRAEAVGLFARAAQVATNAAVRARCIFKQAETLAADGRAEEAAAVFATVGEGTLRESAQFRRADALQRAGRAEAARDVFREIAAGGGAFAVEAGLRMASLSVASGHVERAVEAYGRLLDEKAAPRPSADQRVRALAGRGRALYRAYRFRDAAKDFAAVARIDPARADEMGFLSALCLYGDGRDREALEAGRRLLASTVNARLKADLLFWLAKCDAGRREWTEAIGGFEAAAAFPGTPEPRRIEALVRAARCAAALPDFARVVSLAARVSTNAVPAAAAAAPGAETPYVAEALVLQGEALIELARFDEAVLVLERAGRLKAPEALLRRAAVSRADCLFAMGADNATRYRAALDAYRAVLREETLTDSARIAVSFKIGRTLEKLRRLEEAIDFYYRNVVLAYYWGAVRPETFETARRHWFDGTARDVFARAALIVADYYEGRGEARAAAQVLRYLVAARVPASEQAARRIARMKEKGSLE